jgi:hypothetical protein
VLGGYILTKLSWRWIFSINVPIGLLSLAASLLLLPNVQRGVRRAMEPVGLMLVTGGMLCVVYGLLEGERYAWEQSGDPSRSCSWSQAVPLSWRYS